MGKHINMPCIICQLNILYIFGKIVGIVINGLVLLHRDRLAFLVDRALSGYIDHAVRLPSVTVREGQQILIEFDRLRIGPNASDDDQRFRTHFQIFGHLVLKLEFLPSLDLDSLQISGPPVVEPSVALRVPQHIYLSLFARVQADRDGIVYGTIGHRSVPLIALICFLKGDLGELCLARKIDDIGLDFDQVAIDRSDLIDNIDPVVPGRELHLLKAEVCYEEFRRTTGESPRRGVNECADLSLAVVAPRLGARDLIWILRVEFLTDYRHAFTVDLCRLVVGLVIGKVVLFLTVSAAFYVLFSFVGALCVGEFEAEAIGSRRLVD